ncbi:DUF2975 domain-containing protein [Octadecabacter ascidiaceicola]|uniref:DUF2975 domain-containing protein n=1 Tax=Octadecabacter ascidiaceicola TaxID=1655543 RepID=A0A238KB81_9RHOB|nr:DUF2975 domain-containing protein [Octadecabacter ascidiaceicola]SMX40090.1 hypothetical protein OCA8868_02267 [Octadecabacter ascidiaceicola]
MLETRLPRIARIFHSVTVASLVMLPLLLIVGIGSNTALPVNVNGYADLSDGAWPVSVWLGLFVGLIPFVFSMFALNAMRRLFGLYRSGDPLDPKAAPLIKAIGFNLLVAAVLGVVLTPIQTGLMSMSNPAGERSISAEISSSDIGFILVAGLMMLIGWSMNEASKIAAENREFV